MPCDLHSIASYNGSLRDEFFEHAPLWVKSHAWYCNLHVVEEVASQKKTNLYPKIYSQKNISSVHIWKQKKHKQEKWEMHEEGPLICKFKKKTYTLEHIISILFVAHKQVHFPASQWAEQINLLK